MGKWALPGLAGRLVRCPCCFFSDCLPCRFSLDSCWSKACSPAPGGSVCWPLCP